MLKVVFLDKIGYVEISIPDGVIDMLDGKAFFSDGENDYRAVTVLIIFPDYSKHHCHRAVVTGSRPSPTIICSNAD